MLDTSEGSSESVYRSLVDLAFDAIAICCDGSLVFINESGARMMGAAGSASVVGVPVMRIVHPACQKAMDDRILRTLAGEQVPLTEEKFVRLDGETIVGEVASARIQYHGCPAVQVAVRDITERKRSELLAHLNQERTQLLLQLLQMTSAPLQALYDFVLDAAVRLTGSRYGYFAVLEDDPETVRIHAWSQAVRADCPIAGPSAFIALAGAGIWAEPLRCGKTVITNAYQPDASRPILPPGHLPIERHLGVPILEGGLPVATVGVANKPVTYDELDAQQLSLLLQGMWQVIALREAERRQQEDQERLERYARQLETQGHIDRSTLGAQPLEQIAADALLYLADLKPGLRTRLLLVSQEEQTVCSLAEQPPKGTAGARRFITISPEWLPVADLLRRGEPVWLDGESVGPALAARAREQDGDGYQAMVLVPMLAEGRLVGSLRLSHHKREQLPPSLLATAREFADQLAVVVRQAELRHRLSQYTADLEARVDQRTAELQQAYASLQQAMAEIQDIAEQKHQFVSTVAHELRAPLGNVQLYLDLLEVGHEAKRAQYLATLRREVRVLQRLVDDLLVLARLEAGRASSGREPVDVAQLVSTLVQDRAPMAAARGLRLHAVAEAPLPPVPADPRLLSQVLSNLVTNAVNYTPAGGSVEVRARRADDATQPWVTLSVRDTGPGIAPAEQPFLFTRFFRGEAARGGGAGGSGLGLAICKEIVDLHGGRITVDSQPGEGSTFTVWLPVGPAPVPEPLDQPRGRSRDFSSGRT